MGEKWFEFVKRIKKDGNHASLSEAMKAASARKSEWKKDGPVTGGAPCAKGGKCKKRTKKARKSKGGKSRKSRKSRKGRKGRKGRKSKKN